jgi:quercetin dioxygenase-like cupin family protein
MQSKKAFIENEIVEWEQVAIGVQRAILAYEDSLMVVKVKFEANAVGAKHQHVHVQISYVESGVFDVEVGEETKRLKQGDTFFAASNVWHGVVCIEPGVLIDTFSPVRQDFLTNK